MEFKLSFDWELDLADEVRTGPIDPSGLHLSRVGSKLHNAFYRRYALPAIADGAALLTRRHEFVRQRDQGISCGRAIRGLNGDVIRVLDSRNRRQMISMPDFVDYRKNLIVDLKTFFFRQPPHSDGVLLTTSGPVQGETAPSVGGETMVDCWHGFCAGVHARLKQRHGHQILRYAEAYWEATAREPEVVICVVAYAKTGEQVA
jgi:hypothetical protein